VIALRTTDVDVVVGHNHGVQAGAQRSLGDLRMAGVAIGIARVHVEIEDNFVHSKLSGTETCRLGGKDSAQCGGDNLTFRQTKGIIRLPERMTLELIRRPLWKSIWISH